MYVVKGREIISVNDYPAIYVSLGHLPHCTIVKPQKYGTQTTVVLLAVVKKMNGFSLMY